MLLSGRSRISMSHRCTVQWASQLGRRLARSKASSIPVACGHTCRTAAAKLGWRAARTEGAASPASGAAGKVRNRQSKHARVFHTAVQTALMSPGP